MGNVLKRKCSDVGRHDAACNHRRCRRFSLRGIPQYDQSTVPILDFDLAGCYGAKRADGVKGVGFTGVR